MQNVTKFAMRGRSPANGLRDYPLSLVVGTSQRLEVAGDFFLVTEATTDVYISIDNGPFLKRAEGMGQTGFFRTLELKTLVDQSVRLIVGYGLAVDNRRSVSVSATTTVEVSNQVTQLADVSIPAGSSVQLAAANANRQTLVVKHKASNNPADYVRIGNATVSATSGFELGVGEGIDLDTEAAVYAYNTGSNAVTITLTELNRV